MLDIDSDIPGNFDAVDQKALETLARGLSDLYAAECQRC
jgi:putative methionine-R-sulfoxide reductase with GAF domain